MINLILGAPGGGKSFEAVVFHILPALRKGRKVITNLPLVLEEIEKLNPEYLPLIDLRQDNKTLEISKSTWNPFHRVFDKHKISQVSRPFASIADYGDTWRHPVNGGGPLYVIDECHKCLPSRGTAVDVEEWFAEHRHEFADILLITQSAGKVTKAITESIQLCYRVRKATAFGSDTSYIRKVQDGLRGDIVNESIRKYKPEFFKYYKSHTKSPGMGSEAVASDVVPFWRRWPVLGAGICFLGVVGMLVFGKASVNPMTSASANSLAASKAAANASGLPALPGASSVPSVPVVAAVIQSAKLPSHPFEGLSIHISSFIQSSTRWRYSFTADQNGQPTFNMTQAHLEQSGYTIDRLSECSVLIHYQQVSFYATCDTRSVGMARGLAGNG